MINKSQNAIDYLGYFDSQFGLLPIIASIKEFSNTKQNSLDLTNFLTRTRQLMALEESFSGPNTSKQQMIIQNQTKPEKILFDYPIHRNKLPRNFIEQIFSPLIENKKINAFEQDMPRGYKIQKNPNLMYPAHLPEEIREAINLPNQTKEIDVIERGLTDNYKIIGKRIQLTNDLIFEMDKLEGINFIHSVSGTKLSTISKEIASYPLVGTAQGFRDQTVIYLMSCLETHKQVPLENLNIELDHFFPKIFEKHSEINEIIKKCSVLCKPIGRQIYLTKLIARPKNSKIVCAIYFLTFSKDLIKDRKNPLMQLYRNLMKEFKGWDLYFPKNTLQTIRLTEVSVKGMITKQKNQPSFINEKIFSVSKCFIVVSNNKIIYGFEDAFTIQNLGNRTLEDFTSLLLEIEGISMKSYFLDEQNIIFVIGELKNSREEAELLFMTMDKVGLHTYSNIISSIVGVPFGDSVSPTQLILKQSSGKSSSGKKEKERFRIIENNKFIINLNQMDDEKTYRIQYDSSIYEISKTSAGVLKMKEIDYLVGI